MKILLGTTIGVFVVILAARAFAMPIAPLEKNYTQLVQKANCTTTCTVENCGRNWDDGQGRCRQVCRQHCY